MEPRRTPRYVHVASRLLAGIRGGRYPIGALLPTEAVLCRRFGVSRITVRGAMRELERRGLVARRPGIGTRVTADAPHERFVQAVESIEDISQLTRDLRFRVLDAREEPLEARTAAEWELPAGARFLRVDGLRIDASGNVYCRTTLYIAPAFAVPAAALADASGPIAQWLAERAGDPIAEVRQITEARNLAAGEARLLGVPARRAALVTRRWYFGASGRLQLAAASVFARGRFSASIRRDPLAAPGSFARTATSTSTRS